MKGFVGTRDKISKLGESRKRQRSLRCWLKGSSSHRDCRILLITGKWFVVSVNIFFPSLCSLFKAGYNQSLSKKKNLKKGEISVDPSLQRICFICFSGHPSPEPVISEMCVVVFFTVANTEHGFTRRSGLQLCQIHFVTIDEQSSVCKLSKNHSLLLQHSS